MLRHVVLFRWKPEISGADIQSVRDSLAELPTSIPEICSYKYGDDVRLSDGNFDFALVADFENTQGFQTYAAHPDHQRVIAERIRPLVEERVAVQYEF